jgi:hypothetical protein
VGGSAPRDYPNLPESPTRSGDQKERGQAKRCPLVIRFGSTCRNASSLAGLFSNRSLAGFQAVVVALQDFLPDC